LRIAYAISTLKRSGPVNVLHELVRQAANRGAHVTIITLSPEPLQSRAEDFQRLGATLVPLNLHRFWGLPMLASAFLEAVRASRPDVLHTHCFRTDLLSALTCRGSIPSITTLHNDPFEDYAFRFGPIMGTAVALAHIAIARRLDRAAALNRHLAKKFARMGVPAIAIPNGIDADLFYEPPRKQLSSPSAVLTGHLSVRKDPLTMLDALPVRDLATTFVGNGPLLQKARSEVSRRRLDVTFAGRQANIRPWLKRASIFVSCSRSEGLPLAVLEALAANLFCVLSDIPAHREIAARFPDNTILFETGNHRSLASALSDACSATPEHLTRELFRATPYSNMSMGRDYFAAYLDLAPQPLEQNRQPAKRNRRHHAI